MDFLSPFVAVVAAIGFSLVFGVKKEQIWIVGVLSYAGFMTRNFALYLGGGIELAVLFGALGVAILSDLFSVYFKKQLGMLKVPAGIVMIPGITVFEAIKTLILFISEQTPNTELLTKLIYLSSKSIFILAALAFGLTATSILFKDRSMGTVFKIKP